MIDGMRLPIVLAPDALEGCYVGFAETDPVGKLKSYNEAWEQDNGPMLDDDMVRLKALWNGMDFICPPQAVRDFQADTRLMKREERAIARLLRRRTRPGYMWWKDEQDLGLRN